MHKSLKFLILCSFPGKVKDRYFDTLCIKITVFIWRRERDLNPRDAINAYTISNRALSATQPSLQLCFKQLGYNTTLPHFCQAFSDKKQKFSWRRLRHEIMLTFHP